MKEQDKNIRNRILDKYYALLAQHNIKNRGKKLGLLEQVLQEELPDARRVESRDANPGLLEEDLDFELLKSISRTAYIRVINGIRTDIMKKTGTDLGTDLGYIDIKNKHALELYQTQRRLLQQRRRGLRNFGPKSYHVLEEYLKEKGLFLPSKSR